MSSDSAGLLVNLLLLFAILYAGFSFNQQQELLNEKGCTGFYKVEHGVDPGQGFFLNDTEKQSWEEEREKRGQNSVPVVEPRSSSGS